MKRRPERGLGILLISGFIGLVVMASCGAEKDAGAEPADAPAIVEQDGFDEGDGNYDYAGRWGSGSQYSDGSWNHYSEAAGGAVGGTSDGCIYTTFGWSNC